MKNVYFGAGILSVMLAGCHKHEHADDHEHGEPKTAQITVWTNGYEVFAEHRAPAAGKPMQFVTHVTDLTSFEPRREGAATFVMQRGPQRLEHAEVKPTRDGIYLPKLVFPEPGEWDVTVVIATGGRNAIVPLGKIAVHKDTHAAAHAEFPEPPEGISFLKEQQWKLPTATELVGKRGVTERIRVGGQTRSKPGNSAEIVSPVPGQIVQGGKAAMPGDRVEAGQVLATVQPRFTEATARLAEVEGEYTRTRAELATAEAMLARARNLRAEGVSSQVELEEAEVAVKRAQGNFEAAKALRALYQQKSSEAAKTSGIPYVEVRAPIAGIVNRALAGAGAAVSEGQALFSIVNPEALWIEANVPEAIAQKLGNAEEAAYERTSKPGELIEGGKRVFIGLAIDPESRSMPVIYEIGKGPRIGEAVNLYLQTQRAEDVIAVPESALVEEAGQPVAFVQLAGETFEKRTLKLGIRDGRFVQVLEGLAVGERVVTKGAFAIRLASVSGVIPAHGHSH